MLAMLVGVTFGVCKIVYVVMRVLLRFAKCMSSALLYVVRMILGLFAFYC